MRHRIWRMTYGWRSNYSAAAQHMTASVLYGQISITGKHPALGFKRMQAGMLSMFEMVAGIGAMAPKWVRTGKAHRWEVK